MKGALLCQGAEARVYEGTWLNKQVIIKHRFPKKYRHSDLDTHITRDRMKAEARALTRCRMAGIAAPCVYDLDLFAQEIIMERIQDADTVRNVIYQYASEGKCPFVPKADDGSQQEQELCPEMHNLATKIGLVIGKMHKNNIIHGDLTTSNMMLRKPFEESDIVLIDFGLGSLEEKAEDKAVDLYVLERAILSTHPNTEGFVAALLKAYETQGGKATKAVISKLDEVRLRGRKKLCFG